MTNISNCGSLLFGTLAEKLQVSQLRNTLLLIVKCWLSQLKALQEAGQRLDQNQKGLKWKVVEFAALPKERPVAMGRERGWPLLSPCAIFNFPPSLLNVDILYFVLQFCLHFRFSGKTLCGSDGKASDINSFCSCGFDFWFSHLSCCQPVPGVSEAHSRIGTGSSANVG